MNIEQKIHTVVTDPIDWFFKYNELIHQDGLLRFWILSPPALFGLVAPDIRYYYFGNKYIKLTPRQARQFWRAYKKWCKLTRNQILK